jgi:hypothetical protein
MNTRGVDRDASTRSDRGERENNMAGIAVAGNPDGAVATITGGIDIVINNAAVFAGLSSSRRLLSMVAACS